jgi:integrase
MQNLLQNGGTALMPRPRKLIPTYRKHSSGRAAVSIYRANGIRTEVLLPGDFGSEQSKQEYERLLCQLRANGGHMSVHVAKKDITIAELVLKFMEYANTYYVDPITKVATNEVIACRAALRPLCRLYADTPAVEFGPLALHSLRDAMISGVWLTEQEVIQRRRNRRPIGLARTTCNRNVGRIKFLFKWASSVELIPASIYHALATVTGMRRGRTVARETKTITPISTAAIDDTLPYLPPVVRDMGKLLLLTGMRCGEICIMRACDLDMSGDVWIYRPERHKGLWRGKERAIAIGPRAQSLIKKYFTTKPDAYLFSPREQTTILNAEKRRKRKTPVQPSQRNRRKPNLKRRLGERFEVRAVNRAIRRACERAGIEVWHTHQLRHSASLTFCREMGLENARAALGHSSVDMSAMYAGHDLDAAKKVAQKVG